MKVFNEMNQVEKLTSLRKNLNDSHIINFILGQFDNELVSQILENVKHWPNTKPLSFAETDLLKGLTAMLLVYPAGGRGDADDRYAAVYKAISAYEAATGKKWSFPGTLQNSQERLKEVVS